jgi:hypothetical protein
METQPCAPLCVIHLAYARLCRIPHKVKPIPGRVAFTTQRFSIQVLCLNAEC